MERHLFSGEERERIYQTAIEQARLRIVCCPFCCVELSAMSLDAAISACDDHAAVCLFRPDEVLP